MTTTSRRDRYREETRREVKDHALAQLAESGGEGLSLNAIARQMGMTGPALYRYFANRDQLLSELVVDAYDDLADTMEDAAEGGLRAVATAMRAWALAHPHRYLLIFGTPLPGFQAPERATVAARRSMRVLLFVLEDGSSDGRRRKSALDRQLESAPWVPEEFRRLGGPLLTRALLSWSRLHGLLSLEVTGQFTTMGFEPALLYDVEVDGLTSTMR